jgi:hypothetical protein
MILIFGCLRRLVSLVLLVAIVAAIWYFRADIMAKWRQFRGETPAAVSPEEAARSANAKMAALESANPPARTALSEPELQALLRSRFAPALPAWLDSTRIRLEGDRIRLSGRVPLDHLPQVRDLGQVAGLLPDTSEVAVTGQVIPLSRGRVALAVDQVTAAHIPLPRRLIPDVLGRMKKPGDTTPSDALSLPLPRTISSAYVRNDSLILLSGAGAGAVGGTGRGR